jgi:DNA-binding transcriptional LysR family regulator
VKKVSAATRAVIAGAVVVAALGTGAVLALDGRRPAAQAEDANASAAGAQSTQPSPTSTAASPTPPGPALLMPNMRSLKPTDLQIEVVGNERRLRFAASLANFGPGPLLVLPQGRSKCPRGQHPAMQVVHRDANNDGAFQLKGDKAELRRDVGCMLHHPGHKHWHYDAMARYSLRLPGSDEALVARNKVSFCLRDNRRVRVPAQMQVARQFRRCTRSSQGQGVSPGWTDLYKADLNGQWLRLPKGVDGDVLCLDLEADPRGQLIETNEMDNATSIAIRVDGTKVRTVNSAPCR